MMHPPRIYCWIWFDITNFTLGSAPPPEKEFYIYFHEEYCAIIFFLVIHCWFWYQNNTDLINVFGNLHPSIF